MSHSRLNAYRVMWLFVFFDLPTNTKKERKAAQGFRKNLLKNGFTMMQYSVYTRHCASAESVTVHLNRINKSIPSAGHVSIVQITDKQYSNIQNFWGISSKPLGATPQQLELF